MNPEAWNIQSYAVLENADSAKVTDGYYPAPYWVEHDDKTYPRVVDYKEADQRPLEIVAFEYR